jgi:predicted amidohydrolase
LRAAITAACVQAEPAVLDRDATLEKLSRLTSEAAGNGATLVAFPEAFVPVYPSSVWVKALAGWSAPGAKAAFAAIAREAGSPSPAQRPTGSATLRASTASCSRQE